MITEIKRIIKCYFPKNMKWGLREYFLSDEYIRMTKHCEEVKGSNIPAQLYTGLREVCKNFEVIQWSNFDIYNDIEFKVLLHKNQQILDNDVILLKDLKGIRLDLEIYISMLGRYFYLLPVETRYEKNVYCFRHNFTLTREMRDLIEQIREYFRKIKYQEVDDAVANTIIPEVETELQNEGNASIFNCIFNDMTTIPLYRDLPKAR